jgi:hypothetical protein
MKTKYSPSQRKEIIKNWQESGLGKREFCRQQGLHVSTFDYWINREKLAGKAKKEVLMPSRSAHEGFVELKLSAQENIPQFLRIHTPRGLCIEVPL